MMSLRGMRMGSRYSTAGQWLLGPKSQDVAVAFRLSDGITQAKVPISEVAISLYRRGLKGTSSLRVYRIIAAVPLISR